MKYKTKKTLKTILLSVLGVGAIVGAASGINTLVEKQNEDLKTIYPLFSIGTLNGNGEYVEADDTLYTKTAFECQGLKITLDFDNTIDYQIFYYDSEGEFLNSSGLITGNSNKFASVPDMATHARLTIIPDWDKMGGDYEFSKNQVIKYTDIVKYTSQIKVEVNKTQYELVTLENSLDSLKTLKFFYTSGMTWDECIDKNPEVFTRYDEDDTSFVLVSMDGGEHALLDENGDEVPLKSKVDLDHGYSIGDAV